MTTAATKKRVRKKPEAQTAMTRREKEEWRNIVESAYGCLSWVDYSVDEYLREKRAETEREDAQ